MQHLMKEVEAKVLGGVVVDMQTLKIFGAVSWLMSAADTDKHRQWVKAAFDKAGSGAAPKALDSATTEAANTTAKRIQAEQEMATATMALFKRKRTCSKGS